MRNVRFGAHLGVLAVLIWGVSCAGRATEERAGEAAEAIVLAEQAELTPAATASVQHFGRATAISGGYALVSGATLANGAGTVTAFARSGASWANLGDLSGSGVVYRDAFGYALGLDGNTGVVGAPYANEGGSIRGAAYVFLGSGTTWTQQAKLTPSDPQDGAYFGSHAAISGDTVVIGAPFYSVQPGVAYVFVRTGSSWTQQARLTASDGIFGDNFGFAVAIDGDTLVAGARTQSNGGAAYVFQRTGTTWTQQAKLTASGGDPHDRFGEAVAVSGGTAVVTAPVNQLYSGPGAAYVFERSGTAWTQQAKLTSGGGTRDYFGQSVGISGGTVAIGSPGSLNQQGAVFLFDKSSGAWAQSGVLTASDGLPDHPVSSCGYSCYDPNLDDITYCCTTITQTGDLLGSSLDFSGSDLITSAPIKDHSTGAAYVFAASVDLCAGVTCAPLDACHVAGTCDHATGLCDDPLAADGTACDDGHACTAGDTCQAGACVAGPLQQGGACTPICVTLVRGGPFTVEDAIVNLGAPAKGYGASQSLSASTGSGGQRYGLLRFDLAPIPSGALVTSATLQLTTLLYGGAPTLIHRATAAWSEGTVTWASFNGAFAAPVEGTLPASGAQSADLTALVHAWLAGAVANDGLVLERTADGMTVFASSEAPAGQRPRLDVCYVP